MAAPAVTYTFANSTVADATQVNQNFTDIINGVSDGTKDLSINALTVAGTATFNGAMNFGNATSDDMTFTGLSASDFKPKTDATYNLGSTTLGWLGLYLGKNSNRVLFKNNDSASASWTFTVPVNAGVAGQTMINQGSGLQAWKYACADTAAKSADYIVTDTDMIRTILMTTGGSTRTVTLPTAADNPGRILTLKKVDSAAGFATFDGENSETIDGALTFSACYQYDEVTIQCDGSNWHILGIAPYCRTSFTLDGNFSGGNRTLHCSRVGNVVTLTCNGDPTIASGSNPSTSAGLIPATFRPGATVQNVCGTSATLVYITQITSAGTLTMIIRDWAGTATATTTPAMPWIMYVKTDA